MNSMESAAKINQILERRGWSQTRLAKRAGVRQSTMAQIIAGNRKPRVNTAMKIADALEVPVAWLFDDSKGWEDRKNSTASDSLDDIGDIELMDTILNRLRRSSRIYWELMEAFSEEQTELEIRRLPRAEKEEIISRMRNGAASAGMSIDMIDALIISITPLVTAIVMCDLMLDTDLFKSHVDTENPNGHPIRQFMSEQGNKCRREIFAKSEIDESRGANKPRRSKRRQ